jgi:hypothetical protein
VLMVRFAVLRGPAIVRAEAREVAAQRKFSHDLH